MIARDSQDNASDLSRLYCNIKRWSELSQKAGFLATFEKPFVYALLRPTNNAPSFCQKKSLMKLLGHGKFKSIAFVVVKVFKDFCTYSASVTWSILGGFRALSLPNKA